MTPRAIDLPGADLDHVVSYAELLGGARGLPEPGSSVAVIGAGGIGVDVAHLLSHRGGFYARYGLRGERPSSSPPVRTVTLMRRGERVGERIGPSTRWAVLAELRAAGVRTLTGIHYERIEPGAVWIRDPAGERVAVPADTVVVCAGQRPERTLAAQLRGGRPAAPRDRRRGRRRGARCRAGVSRGPDRPGAPWSDTVDAPVTDQLRRPAGP